MGNKFLDRYYSQGVLSPTRSIGDEVVNGNKYLKGYQQEKKKQSIQQQPDNGTPVTVTDVLGEVPSSIGKVGAGTFNFFFSNLKGLFTRTGALIGEAAAYAIDKNVREQATKSPEAFAEILPTQANSSVRKIAGETLGAAFEVAPFAKAAKIVSSATKVKPTLTKLISEGAKVGGIYGGGFGLASALQDDAVDVGVIAKDTAISSVIGAGTGALLTPLLSRLSGKIAEQKAAKKISGAITKDGSANGSTLSDDISSVYDKLRDTAQEEAAKQLDFHKLTKEAGIVRGVDLGGTSNLSQAENAIMKALTGSGADDAALQDVSSYFRSMEQVRFENFVGGGVGIHTPGQQKITFPGSILTKPQVGRASGIFSDIAPVIDEKVQSTTKKVTNLVGRFSPSTRVDQTSTSYARKIIGDIEKSKQYVDQLNKLGGGRVVSNEQTFIKAAEDVASGRGLTIKQIQGWKAGTPVNESIVAQAMVHRGAYIDKLESAINSLDDNAANDAFKILLKTEAGFNNITATPGRATQVQSADIAKRSQEFYNRVRQLQKEGASYQEISKVISEENAATTKLLRLKGIAHGASRILDAVETYATAAKLTSISTHIVNTVSNTITYVQRGAEKIAVAGQTLVSDNPSAAKGIVANTFGTRTGFVDGSKKFLQTLIEESPDLIKSELPKSFQPSGITAESLNVARKQFSELSLAKKVARTANPFRWLAAADNFWKALITDSELNTRAYRRATSEGLTGDSLAKRVTELMNDPPENWVEDAFKVAKEYTFQEDPDTALKAMLKLRNLKGMRLIIPFIQTPYNIVKFQLQRSGVALLSPRNISAIAKGGVEREEALARVTIGAGLTLTAFSIAQNGEITGAFPKGPAEQQKWIAEGKQAWSIKIGDKWVNYQRFQPVGLYLTQVALLKDALADGNDADAQSLVSRLVFGAAQSVKDMPFVAGLSSMFDALNDPERYGAEFINQTVIGFIPGAVRDIRIQTDDYKRNVETVMDAIKNTIPGVSQSLSKKIDVLGRDRMEDPNHVNRLLKFIKTPNETPVTDFLDIIDYSPTPPDTSFTAGDTDVKLEGKQREEYLRQMGAATESAIRQAMNVPSILLMTKEDQANLVGSLITNYRSAVKKQWVYNNLQNTSGIVTGNKFLDRFYSEK